MERLCGELTAKMGLAVHIIHLSASWTQKFRFDPKVASQLITGFTMQNQRWTSNPMSRDYFEFRSSHVTCVNNTYLHNRLRVNNLTIHLRCLTVKSENRPLWGRTRPESTSQLELLTSISYSLSVDVFVSCNLLKVRLFEVTSLARSLASVRKNIQFW